MVKKLNLVFFAIAVVAVAVPTVAQANPELTIGGKKATVGQQVTGTSTNVTTLTSLGTIKCLSIATHGWVAINSGTTVFIEDGSPIGNTKGTGCTVGGKAVTVENMTLTEIAGFSGKKAGETGNLSVRFHFKAKIGEVMCTFWTAGSTGTYVSGASPLVITFTNTNLIGEPAACEPGTLNGTFTVTSGVGVVVLH